MPERDREIEGRRRRGDVERHAVLFREHRDRIGSDLVGDVAVRSDPVRPHDHEIDVAGSHEMARHVVGDERDVDAVLHATPRPSGAHPGERVGSRPRRRRIFLPDFDRGAHDAEGGAVTRRRESSRVAVRQDPGSVRDEGSAVCFPCGDSSRCLRPEWRAPLARGLPGSRRCPAGERSSNRLFMRSMAQKRLTAVGRVEAMSSETSLRTSRRRSPSAASACFSPRAMPIAAVTPIAGAPRTTISLIAARRLGHRDRQRTPL